MSPEPQNSNGNGGITKIQLENLSESVKDIRGRVHVLETDGCPKLGIVDLKFQTLEKRMLDYEIVNAKLIEKLDRIDRVQTKWGAIASLVVGLPAWIILAMKLLGD